MNSPEFGRRLRERREAEGKSQEQVAKAAKCSRGMISQWESGTPKRIDATTLLLVARYLRTTADYLLEGEKKITEEHATYAPEQSPLGDDWLWLTVEQRRRVQGDVRQMADHNRKVFEQISAERARSVASD